MDPLAGPYLAGHTGYVSHCEDLELPLAIGFSRFWVGPGMCIPSCTSGRSDAEIPAPLC